MHVQARHGRFVGVPACTLIAALAVAGMLDRPARAQTPKEPDLRAMLEASPYPLSDELARFRKAASPKSPGTGVTRSDYLRVAAGIVRFFARYQDAQGAIIDPYEHRERQYATPAFACAAAALVRSGVAPEMRGPAERAFRWAAAQLAAGKAADGHSDFYTVLLMHARELLARPDGSGAPSMPSFDPLKIYRDLEKPHNWNVVALSGEYLRSRDGLAAGSSFTDEYLTRQVVHFNRFGMYCDPQDPLAYDAFPRLWLTDMLAHGYDGKWRGRLEALLTQGAVTALFMQSPLGELPAGGRSGGHQWNEAQQAATFEIMAKRFEAADTALAGAFKRAAHLALLLMRRWLRPTGELWIAKNRFPPEMRYGYESYSFHSQYNLLAAAMLAMAWQHADDAITEAGTPAETGGFAFVVDDGFNKVFANSGGVYVEYELAGDPHYNPTGIIRVVWTAARANPGGARSAHALLEDGAVAQPAYGTGPYGERRSLALGAAWVPRGARAAGMPSLASRALGTGEWPFVRVLGEHRGRVGFQVRYANAGCPVEETVTVLHESLRVTESVACAERTGATVPFLVNDGAGERSRQPIVRVKTPGATTRRMHWQIPSRYGLLDAIEVQAPGERIEYEVRSEPRR